jgi:translation initiation factor 2 subunit 3
MESQPILNIGVLGSVSDGKSTMVYKLTGIKTQRHTDEKYRNITIKQGYGNMKVWFNGHEYTTTDSNYETEDTPLVNHISWVDCPGHLQYIETTLNAMSLMDCAVVIVAADQPISKKPQLIQHLKAAKMVGLDNLIFVINKIDLVDKTVLETRKTQLDDLLNELEIEPKIIIPACFNKSIGLDWLVESIQQYFRPRERETCDTLIRITRSFDINKPGTDWSLINGGVIGGSLISGSLKKNDELVIYPGVCSKKGSNWIVQPINTKVLSVQTDNKELDTVIPGGLIAIKTDIDSFYTKSDGLSGSICVLSNNKLNLHVYIEANIVCSQLNSDINNGSKLVLQIGSRTIPGTLLKKSKNWLKVGLNKPTCILDNDMIIICSNIENVLTVIAKGSLASDNKFLI